MNTPLWRCHPARLTMKSGRNALLPRVPAGCSSDQQGLWSAIQGGWLLAVWLFDSDFTPSLPTKIIPTKIVGLKLAGRFPVDLGFPPLQIKTMLEANPLRSRILVRRLAVPHLSHSLHMCMHIYIYIYIYSLYSCTHSVCICIHIYIYIYI